MLMLYHAVEYAAYAMRGAMRWRRVAYDIIFVISFSAALPRAFVFRFFVTKSDAVHMLSPPCRACFFAALFLASRPMIFFSPLRRRQSYAFMMPLTLRHALRAFRCYAFYCRYATMQDISCAATPPAAIHDDTPLTLFSPSAMQH